LIARLWEEGEMALSYLRQTYLNELEEFFQENGRYPDKLNPYVLEPEFKTALKSRNLPIPKSREATGLDSVQRAVIRLISDYHDKRPIRQKLKDFEIDSKTYQSWLKIPNFRLALEQAVTRSLSLSPLDAKIALSQLILDRDLNAIKYFNELTGIYRPSSDTNINLTLVLSKVLDVLVRHVSPDVLQTVANELEAVLVQSDTPPVNQQINGSSSSVDNLSVTPSGETVPSNRPFSQEDLLALAEPSAPH